LDAGLLADPPERGGPEPVGRRVERVERERLEGRDAGRHERAPLVPVDPGDEREVVGRDALALTAGAPLADLAELGGLRSAGKRVGAGRGFEVRIETLLERAMVRGEVREPERGETRVRSAQI